MLTQNKLTQYKDDYRVYGHEEVTDKYGGTATVLSEKSKGTINVMWNPVTDESAIAEYGERVNRMLEAVLYEGKVEELDVIRINGTDYEVRSIMPYNTHRLIRVEKI